MSGFMDDRIIRPQKLRIEQIEGLQRQLAAMARTILRLQLGKHEGWEPK